MNKGKLLISTMSFLDESNNIEREERSFRAPWENQTCGGTYRFCQLSLTVAGVVSPGGY